MDISRETLSEIQNWLQDSKYDDEEIETDMREASSGLVQPFNSNSNPEVLSLIFDRNSCIRERGKSERSREE